MKSGKKSVHRSQNLITWSLVEDLSLHIIWFKSVNSFWDIIILTD